MNPIKLFTIQVGNNSAATSGPSTPVTPLPPSPSEPSQPDSGSGSGVSQNLKLPYVEAVYNVTSTTTATKILYSAYYISYGVDCMEVDDKLVEPVTSIKFSSKGEHTMRVVSGTVGNTAFYGCTKLIKAVVPMGITRIGNQAFADCAILRDITLPDTITNVGDKIFDTFSDGIIRINGQLTDFLREVITTYFKGCQLYVNGTASGTIS